MTEPPSPSRGLSLAVTLVAGVTFVTLAGLLVPWDWLPGGQLSKVAADDVFTVAEIERGEHVSGLLRLAGWGNLVLSVVVAALLGFTRLGSAVVGRLPGRWWVRTILAALLVTAIGRLATLPLAWSAQRVELSEGLSRQAWGSWVADQALGLGVSWTFATIALLMLVGLARRVPRTWPVWAALAAAGFTMLGSFTYPVVVEPLFNDFTPMARGELRSDILALAEREEVAVEDVLVADASRRTTRLNAYVSGFGSTRRVVVYDTLLTGLPREQVEIIVAHELAHAKHRDVLTGTMLGAVGAAFGVGLLALVIGGRRVLRQVDADGAGDPRLVPCLLGLALVGSLLASPVQSTVSRAVEARADRTSLETTGETETFVAMQKQLALRALADPTPPGWSQFWFGSHPTTLQRIGLARALETD